MVAVLRSVGQQFHPVGKLTVANQFTNPRLVQTGAGIDLWGTFNCTFVADALTPQIAGTGSGKLTLGSAGYSYIYQRVNVIQQLDYVLSAYINVPITLSAYIYFYANIYDASNTFITQLGYVATTGGSTSGYIRTSQVMTVPVGAAFSDFFILVYSSGSPEYFFINAPQVQQASAVGIYADGGMSGYVWSGSPDVSTSLKSEFPDALSAFGTYPLAGGMGAAGSMFNPQYERFLD